MTEFIHSLFTLYAPRDPRDGDGTLQQQEWNAIAKIDARRDIENMIIERKFSDALIKNLSNSDGKRVMEWACQFVAEEIHIFQAEIYKNYQAKGGYHALKVEGEPLLAQIIEEVLPVRKLFDIFGPEILNYKSTHQANSEKNSFLKYLQLMLYTVVILVIAPVLLIINLFSPKFEAKPVTDRVVEPASTPIEVKEYAHEEVDGSRFGRLAGYFLTFTKITEESGRLRELLKKTPNIRLDILASILKFEVPAMAPDATQEWMSTTIKKLESHSLDLAVENFAAEIVRRHKAHLSVDDKKLSDLFCKKFTFIPEGAKLSSSVVGLNNELAKMYNQLKTQSGPSHDHVRTSYKAYDKFKEKLILTDFNVKIKQSVEFHMENFKRKNLTQGLKSDAPKIGIRG